MNINYTLNVNHPWTEEPHWNYLDVVADEVGDSEKSFESFIYHKEKLGWSVYINGFTGKYRGAVLLRERK
jgi:hypothetical protein